MLDNDHCSKGGRVVIRRCYNVAFLMFFLSASSVVAQGDKHSHVAPNGGQIVNIGKYEAELLITGKKLVLYLTDEQEKKVDPKPFIASAMVLAKGNKRNTVKLLPVGVNRLEGQYSFETDDQVRAVVTLTLNGKSVGKGRYKVQIKR